MIHESANNTIHANFYCSDFRRKCGTLKLGVVFYLVNFRLVNQARMTKKILYQPKVSVALSSRLLRYFTDDIFVKLLGFKITNLNHFG